MPGRNFCRLIENIIHINFLSGKYYHLKHILTILMENNISFMNKLKYSDLKKDMTVRDNDGNYGKVKKIKDEHNIIVEFVNPPGKTGCTGGYGFYCIDPECTDYYDPIYKAE